MDGTDRKRKRNESTGDPSERDSLLEELAHAPDLSPPEVRIGTTVGRYRLDAVLGRGGMGVVYRAHDTRLDRSVALKLVREGFSADASRKARLLREARAAAALNHPNVVSTYDAGEDGAQTYLAMELVVGQTLRARLAAGTLPLPEVMSIAKSIAAALAAAHAQKLLHRDLKPDNVMLDGRGMVKVLDFGLAKSMPSEDADVAGAATVTAEGSVAGTPAYMSPEQLESRELDARSDVFAFGVVLYEMLAGVRPFPGDTNNAVVAAILRDAPTPLHELRADAPQAWIDLVNECLSKSPSGRPASGQALVTRLAEIEHEREAPPVQTVVDRAPRARSRLALPALLVVGIGGALGALGWKLRIAPSDAGAAKTTAPTTFGAPAPADNPAKPGDLGVAARPTAATPSVTTSTAATPSSSTSTSAPASSAPSTPQAGLAARLAPSTVARRLDAPQVMLAPAKTGTADASMGAPRDPGSYQ